MAVAPAGVLGGAIGSTTHVSCPVRVPSVWEQAQKWRVMNIANGNIEVICCWNLLVQLRGLTCNVGILEHLPPRSISGIADSALHARTDLVMSCGVMVCHSQPIIAQFPSISNLQLEGFASMVVRKNWITISDLPWPKDILLQISMLNEVRRVDSCFEMSQLDSMSGHGILVVS